jgi:hypothetical protein
MQKLFYPVVYLQLFADGGDGGTATGEGVTAAAALPQTKGVKNNPLANVKYGIQPEEAPAAEAQKPAPVDRNAEFEKLIKGDYKEQYDAKVQSTIRARLKGSQETVDKYNALTPTLELLAKKYGVADANDIKALTAAIEEDDSFWEEEAMKKGLSVQQYKEVRKMERENAQLRQQMQEQERKEGAKKLYAQWFAQAEEAKQVYPTLDLEAEMQNPQFRSLLQSNVPVRTAYEVLHKDEIISGAMQFTAKTVEEKLAKKIQSGASRPVENGMSSQGASLVKSDVSQLSKADRAEIIRRVQRGEKIRF